MGQAYCVGLCGEKTQAQLSVMEAMLNNNSDQPINNFAVKVKQHIELRPKVKETYLLYRTPHASEKKGTKLQLYYLFDFSAYYEGEWKNGLPHGFGRVIYDDGSLYEGCFSNGIAQCMHALFIKDDGIFFRGTIKANKAQGYGELNTQKLFYKGNWDNDLPNGKAREIYSSASFFQGQFKNGRKQGSGVYQWNANQYYIGKFKDNKLNGKGDLITRDYTYQGQFKDNKKEGEGLYTDLTGKFVFKGTFKDNYPYGQGKINYQDGAIFTGYFQGFNKRRGTLKLIDGQLVQIDTFNQEQVQSHSNLTYQL